LTASHPRHVVTAWIGNTPDIARKHYLQVRDEDFERATQTPMGADKCARNPAQYAAEQGATEHNGTASENLANAVFRLESAPCELAQVHTGAGDGANEIRTPCDSASKTLISQNGPQNGTQDGTPKAENTPSDPLDLALLQERWPKLPEHIKAAVLALVRSTSDKEQSA